jgi:hypothetical protein
MAQMPKPLQSPDPGELGPFRLESRLHEAPEGIVYLGVDPQGRQVEVALLTTAAAGDPAARDRFRAAVRAETPQHGVPQGAPSAPAPGEPSPLLAAFPEGEAPWVATAYEEGRTGARRFLDSVPLSHGWGMRRRRGPSFQPYWLSGPRGPALQAPEPAVAPTADDRGLATAVIALAALLALLVLLVLLLFSCEPSDPKPPPPSPAPTTSQPQQPQPQPTPSQPSPTPSKTVKPSPRPTGGQDTVNPAGA